MLYIYIYHNLVTEMQAAVAIISVSRSIHHKLSFHCHVMYIFPKYFMYVCIYFQNKGIRIRIRVVLQWIPAHCGISGNGKADELAKRGANMQQENLPITIKQKKTIIKNMF